MRPRYGRVHGKVWEAISRNPPARKPLAMLKYSNDFSILGGLGGFPVPLTYTSLDLDLCSHDALCISSPCAKPSQPSHSRIFAAKTVVCATGCPPKPSHKPSRPEGKMDLALAIRRCCETATSMSPKESLLRNRRQLIEPGAVGKAARFGTSFSVASEPHCRTRSDSPVGLAPRHSES
jgi:hypothetical protein